MVSGAALGRHKLAAMASAPDFYGPIVGWIGFILLIAVFVIEAAAFIHCLTRKAGAFGAVGSIPKGGWVAMTGGAVLFTALFGFQLAGGGLSGLIGIIGVVVAAVYLLDMRPALRDAVDGQGPW